MYAVQRASSATQVSIERCQVGPQLRARCRCLRQKPEGLLQQLAGYLSVACEFLKLELQLL